ncbi:alpha/beta hydrolase-fold protein, partial [Desulfosarcina sp.]|nr:alpha/beta hydrolase-fold protein [Desulfosarcina sp.]
MKKLTILLSNLLIASMLFGQVNIIDDSFYSEVLGQNMMVDVFLPPDYEVNPDQYYPLVYYLHGFGGNQNNLVFYAPTANNLMLNGSIDPFIMVCANNQAGPFGGTMYMNSPLWGDFETYNFTEVVNHIEANYRAIPEKNKRALMGQSMGAAGCFENGPKYKNKFRAIAAHGYSGVMEHCLDDWQTALLNEQVSGPPYFFDFYSGEIFTKLCFLQSGAVAPNLTSPQTYINPTTVEFILDDQGAFIDTVVSKWLVHSGHKLVQGLTPEDDFGILFGCGQNDELLFYQGAAALKDSLDAYGIPSQFFSHNGSHAMPASFKVEAYTFLDSIFNIESNSCLPEGITFTTQEEIDNFQINYPGCNEIEGDVFIGGTFYGTDIQNLDSLIQISAILGSLEIFTNLITDLTGLHGLLSVGGNLKINYNNAITNLSGLENIESVGGDLKIVDNDLLTTLTDWNNIETIGGSLIIAHNDNLINLSEFENLSSIGGTLHIQNNDALLNLSALDNITTIENLYIEGNDLLPSLSGLESIESISGDLIIGWAQGNDLLVNLEGLEGLTSIPGNVIIKLNESLTDLSGLDNLTSIQGNVEIKYHGSLT